MVKQFLLLVYFLTLSISAFCQFDPHAGLIQSHTVGATFFASSNGATVANAFDGNKDTHWQSGAPLPYGFVSNPNQNLVLGQTGNGLTDGHLGRAIILRQGDSGTVNLSNQTARGLLIKANLAGTLTVQVVYTSGNSEIIRTLDNTTNNQLVMIDLPNEPIVSVTVQADAFSQVFELAALASEIEEFVGYTRADLHELGQLQLRTWSGSKPAIATRLEVTQDGEVWSTLRSLDPIVLPSYTIVLDTPIQVKGVRIVHTMDPGNWEKVSIWEIQTYDQYGRYGTLPSLLDTSVNFATMLGVNGLWGWGQNKYSDLLDTFLGPGRYAELFAKGRIYHNLDWDITSPGQVPNYSGMNLGQGTQAKSWLNWDREHLAWHAFALEVNPTIRVSVFPESSYTDPYEQTRLWASDFSSHFGSGVLGTVEIGNEPWSFTSNTYLSILSGAIAGLRENPINFKILPCALQAADSTAEASSNLRNYMGARLNPTILQGLDGLNVHTYSYLTSVDGVRRAVHPEHPGSSWGELNSAIRFRNANAAHLPIYLTELGYDSDGGGQDCLHNECIPEQEAAAYTLRSFLIANRMGIRRADYYFFANSKSEGLYTRSGLVSSALTGSVSKLTYTIIDEFSEFLGPYRVIDVEQENEEAYIYKLSDNNGDIIYAAWLPKTLGTAPATNSFIANKVLVKTFDPAGSQGAFLSPWPSIWR